MPTATVTQTATATITLPSVPGDSVQSWALVNLLFGALGSLLAVTMAIWAFAKSGTKQIRYLWLFLVMIFGAAGVMVFFMTENMSFPMEIVDIWTAVHGVILAAQMLCITLVLGVRRE